MAYNVDQQLLHGGDYNPDQWLDYPEILNQDLDYMQEAHINTVTLGVFAWDALEPTEGQYEFGWLDEAFDRIEKMHGHVILATPSGARPQWLSHDYPEVNRVDDHLQRHHHGFRHDHCFSSPNYRQKVAAIDAHLAKRYAHRPSLIMWHVSNEFSGECFCDLCQANWRQWLQKKYGTLKALNAAWLTSFWSGTYTSWNQIQAPSALSSQKVHGMALDWRRFNTDMTIDFYDAEAKVLKAENPDVPVTTNFMAEAPGKTDFIPLQGLDYAKFAQHVDMVSWDEYPQWGNPYESMAKTALKAAFVHDVYYGLKEKPFLVMESTPGRVNSPVAKAKRPGVHALASFQQIAHGSIGSLYFQIRQARANSEKFHSAVIGHDGTDHSRIFKEVAAYGERLENLGEIAEQPRNARVAIIYDWQSLWAQNREAAFGRDRKRYFQTLEKHYDYFWTHDIPVAVVPSDHNFSDYDLVIAPMLYVGKPDLCKRLAEYVANGGQLVGTYLTDIVDEHDSVNLGEWPLSKLFGVQFDEFDSLYPEDRNGIYYGGSEFVVHDFAQIFSTTTAKVLGTYIQDFYAGTPALTVNHFGLGKAYYLGARVELTGLAHFYEQLAPLGNTLLTHFDPAVSVQARGPYNFVMNFSEAVHTVMLGQTVEDVETGQMVDGAVRLPPYAVRVFKR